MGSMEGCRSLLSRQLESCGFEGHQFWFRLSRFLCRGKNITLELPMPLSIRSSFLCICLSCLLAASALAQRAAAPPPGALTADQDQHKMMDMLGIKALRPGPSGNEKAPNHANIDESKANPYPNLPDPLTMNDGRKVTTEKMWWEERRPEIVEMYSKYVYGRVPRNVPKVTLDRDRGGSRDDRLHAGHCQGSDRHGGQLRRPRDQRAHPHDAGHARFCQRARCRC